jgi:hypothetical protein
MATSASTFNQTWRIGRTAQERAAPHRKGPIRARRGTGPNATIVVALTGSHPTNFRPAQLTPL